MTLIRIRHLLRRQQLHCPARGGSASGPHSLSPAQPVPLCSQGSTRTRHPKPGRTARARTSRSSRALEWVSGMGLRQQLMRPASGGSGLTARRQDAVAGQARAQHNERSDPAQCGVRPLARMVPLALGRLPMAFYTSLSVVLPRIGERPHTGNSYESNEVCIHF